MSKEYEVFGKPFEDIEIGAKGMRAIFQNVQTIVSTWRGTVFLDRTFGINPQVIDKPINVAQADIIIDITEQIEKNEPRIKIVSVTFNPSDANNGELVPLVTFTIKEGVLI